MKPMSMRVINTETGEIKEFADFWYRFTEDDECEQMITKHMVLYVQALLERLAGDHRKCEQRQHTSKFNGKTYNYHQCGVWREYFEEDMLHDQLNDIQEHIKR